MKKPLKLLAILSFALTLLFSGCDDPKSTVAPVTYDPVLTIDRDAAIISLDNTIKITAGASDVTGEDDTITAESGDETVAIVSVNGLDVTVTALKHGSTDITITSGSGLFRVCSVRVVTVYAAGIGVSTYMYDSESGYWKNGTWNKIREFGSFYGRLFSSLSSFFAVSGSNVYAGGLGGSGSAYSTNLYWKDGSWITLTPPAGFTGYIYLQALAVSGNDVYGLGVYSVSSVVYNGYWKNDAWTPLANPAGFTGNVSISPSISVSGDDVYALGSYNNGITYFGYWKNGVWTALAPITAGKAYIINSIIASGNDLYAVGYCANSSNINVPCYWKNGVCTELPLPYLNSSDVKALAVSGDDVYAAGYGRNGSGVYAAGYWKNGVWTELKALDSTRGSEAESIVISGSDVFVGGYCSIDNKDSAADVKIPGYWVNGEWNELPSLYTGRDSEVQALAVVAD